MDSRNHLHVSQTDAIQQYTVQSEVIARILEVLCSRLGVASFELSVQFVGSKEMQELNKTYRTIDRPTDVLAFPQQEWASPITVATPYQEPENDEGPPLMLGDIVISLDEARRNAIVIEHGIDREVCFLLIHGLLHLCGHDHYEEEEERIMLEQQQLLLDTLDNKGVTLWDQCVVFVPAKKETSHGA